jgi:mono/diheme cytochrome c family protein
MMKGLLILGGVAIAGLVVILLFSYDIIKVDWVSFMEIQPSYKPMEDPLPPPPNSVPVEGLAYTPGGPAPENPVPADSVSVSRGKELFALNCAICHGQEGKGDGIVGAALANKPADLTSPAMRGLRDGDIFLTISQGIPDGTGWRMPPLNENLTVRDRWDVVNFIRTVLQSQP